MESFTRKIVAWAGAYLISFVGLLHLLEAGEHLGYASYIGVLFLANFAASAVSALGIAWTGRKWAWLLGAAVAGGALFALLWSRIIGLPGYPDGVGQWFNFLAWMAVIFELSFLALAPLALTSRGSALVKAKQRRIDREEAPPATRETPGHFGMLEKEMAAIRNRARPDLADLRRHLSPSTSMERTKQNLRERMEHTLKHTKSNPRAFLVPVIVIVALIAARSNGKDAC